VSARRIAIVDDDLEVGDFLLQLLKAEGYDAAHYPTPGKFFDAILRRQPALTVLDMQLPGMDGREIIRLLRSNPDTGRMLIVAISGKQRSKKDVISGIQRGADEYFLKPLDSEEFLARLSSLLRRAHSSPAPEDVIRLDGLTIFPERRQCELEGEAVSMTRLEFDLLTHLVRNANRILTRGSLLEDVWTGDPTMSTRTVDKHIEMLRRKLGEFGERIATVIRVGYVLKL